MTIAIYTKQLRRPFNYSVTQRLELVIRPNYAFSRTLTLGYSISNLKNLIGKILRFIN